MQIVEKVSLIKVPLSAAVKKKKKRHVLLNAARQGKRQSHYYNSISSTEIETAWSFSEAEADSLQALIGCVGYPLDLIRECGFW